MTEIDNDKLLKDFFAENKREIADNGFSRRVMHHLPDRSNRLARLWTVFVMTVGATLFVTLGGLGNAERCTYRHDQPWRNQSRSEINHHCNGRPAVHGRTESSINGITMLVTQLCQGLGTVVTPHWHSSATPLAQV